VSKIKASIPIVMIILLSLAAMAVGEEAAKAPPLPKLRFSLEYGYGLRLAEADPEASTEMQDYVNDLLTGPDISADAGYFFNNRWGAGLGIIRFSASNSTAGMFDYSGDTLLSPMKDDVVFSYYGIYLYERETAWLDRAYVIAKAGLGWLTYVDDGSVDGEKVKLDGSAIGIAISISGEYRLPYNLAVGVNLGYLLGTVSDIKLNGKPSPFTGEESASRLDLNLGLKYYWK
jgi:hypothetical protein